MSKTALLAAIQYLIPTQVDTPTVAPTFTRDDVGCYADSARGCYIGCVVIELAISKGFSPYGEDLADSCDSWVEAGCRVNDCYTAMEEYLADREDYLELWGMAENFLNTLCDSDVYFGSSEQRDWGLWEIETEENTDNE